MNIKALERRMFQAQTDDDEPLWNEVQHHCESCGRWAFLWWNGDCWVCDRCRQGKPLQQELGW